MVLLPCLFSVAERLRPCLLRRRFWLPVALSFSVPVLAVQPVIGATAGTDSPPSPSPAPTQSALANQFNAAAFQAARDCLSGSACNDDPLLDAPFGELDSKRSRALRVLSTLAQVSLDAYAREWDSLYTGLDLRSRFDSDIEALQLDRGGAIRLIGLGDYTLIHVQLRGTIRFSCACACAFIHSFWKT